MQVQTSTSNEDVLCSSNVHVVSGCSNHGTIQIVLSSLYTNLYQGSHGHSLNSVLFSLSVKSDELFCRTSSLTKLKETRSEGGLFV